MDMNGPPVDLSFKKLCLVTDAVSETPRIGPRSLNRNSEGKYLSRSVHLCYNRIADLGGLQETLSYFLAQPSQLGWLDLSFNQIISIQPVLCELKELRVLNLHGNSIFDLSEVDKLGELPHLQSITLPAIDSTTCILTNTPQKCSVGLR